MNEFERAREKTDKREQRKTLTLPAPAFTPDVILNDCPAVADIPVPKEKRPSTDGVIKVIVTLPYDTFEISFTKQNILGMKKLTKADFHKTLSEGLKPLLGTLR